ncbi:protein penguin [Stomoxys calcitrans]|uniref:PUM-HD domain-containing protein n=1 Tax=Stomoxys calcitrans TaxID=35570 RepID=A0A1I8Q8R4_STOCA|nr:protein penguin [Stomoxys calcitrans]
MLKSKKRVADKTGTSDEPLKKKTNNESSNNSKPSKFSKPTKPSNGSGGKPMDKFQGKNFSGKPSNFAEKPNKFASRPGNKFAGKPKFPMKQEEGANNNKGEKTDWNKFKQEKKDLKMKRKQGKDTYEISIEAKQIYEKLKCRKTEKKAELVEKLFNLFSTGDTIKKVVMAHDTARVIQCMLKFASPSVREQLSERLMPLAVEMSISKYAHFCVLRMFKYGSPVTKSKLVDAFYGNIVKLACHNISSKILDHVYLTVANAKQKIYMRQEFYGDLYKKTKDDKVKTMADCYMETPVMKASILSAVKANLEHVSNKQLVDNSLVHAIMLEYVKEMEEDKVEETVTMFAPLIPLMLTTKDGCQASIICFYKSTPKNRRAIIKTIKEHLIKICTHEHGHLFIIALLNSLDDTKATKKAIYDTLHPELQTLMANQWGRRVIEWLISPGGTSCFHPTFIATIEEGLQYGKKDKEVRRKEIFEQIEEPIASAISEQPEFWLSDKHIGLVTGEILTRLSSEHFVKASTALAKLIAQPDWSVSVEDETKEKQKKKPQDVEKIIADATKQKTKQRKQAQKASKTQYDNADGESGEAEDQDSDDDEKEKEEIATVNVIGIEEAGLHIILKKIIKNDKERLAADAATQTFGGLLVQELSEETLKSWININRACFILLNIFENNSEDVQQQLRNLLKKHLAQLKKQKFNGAQLLVKKLN